MLDTRQIPFVLVPEGGFSWKSRASNSHELSRRASVGATKRKVVAVRFHFGPEADAKSLPMS